nr:uncharacterized protein LOC129136497 [Pan troglodytes]
MTLALERNSARVLVKRSKSGEMPSAQTEARGRLDWRREPLSALTPLLPARSYELGFGGLTRIGSRSSQGTGKTPRSAFYRQEAQELAGDRRAGSCPGGGKRLRLGETLKAAPSSQLFSPGLLLLDGLPRQEGRLGRPCLPRAALSAQCTPSLRTLPQRTPRLPHVRGQVRWGAGHGRAGSSSRLEALLPARPWAMSDEKGRVPVLAAGG